jgi:hypothetical protein
MQLTMLNNQIYSSSISYSIPKHLTGKTRGLSGLDSRRFHHYIVHILKYVTARLEKERKKKYLGDNNETGKHFECTLFVQLIRNYLV